MIEVIDDNYFIYVYNAISYINIFHVLMKIIILRHR